MNFSSTLLENAVNEISQLPGIGKRTALRLALHLLKQPKENTFNLAKTLEKFRENIIFCENCNNISDTPKCEICKNPNRDENVLCVVEDIRDVMAIENTGLYKGYYHVLGGVISPIEGIGPQDLAINLLIERVSNSNIKEIVFAFSTTMESETTLFYIHKKLSHHDTILFSTIATGIPIGNDLEFADEMTLGRSIMKRVPYQNSTS